jgi:hypothetical protein
VSKNLILTILCFLILSCQGRQINIKQNNNSVLNDSIANEDTWINYNKDSAKVDSIYGKNTWTHHFKPMKNLKGLTIKYKIINNSRYILQWGDSDYERTLTDTFYLDGLETAIPWLIKENDKYVVLESGCGNPCWVGYFIPKDTLIQPLIVHEFLGYNIDDDLVAFVKDTYVLEIINIKTKRTQDIILKGCASAFLGYCIDSLTIEHKIVNYKWTPDTYIESKNGHIKRVKIII